METETKTVNNIIKHDHQTNTVDKDQVVIDSSTLVLKEVNRDVIGVIDLVISKQIAVIE